MLNIGYFITKTTGKWNWCGEAFWKLRAGIGMLANILMFKYVVYKTAYFLLLKIMKTWVNFVRINYLSLTWKVKWRPLFTPIRVTSDKCKLVLWTAITRFYNQQLFNLLFLLGTKKTRRHQARAFQMVYPETTLKPFTVKMSQKQISTKFRNFILWNFEKQIAPCVSTGGEVSFDAGHIIGFRPQTQKLKLHTNK